jgi:hypothetical protein
MRRSCLFALALVLTTCGDDETTPIEQPQPISGTSVVFDLDADLAAPATFYDLPYPSDLRLNEQGGPDLTGWPRPEGGANVPSTVVPAASGRPGFPQQPVAYFRFDGALPALMADEVIAAELASSLLLVDVDPASPDRGTLYPTTAHVHPADDYLPENVLAVGAYPGIVLDGDRSYAFVVKRALGDAAGQPLGVPVPMLQLSSGQTPSGGRGAAAAALYAPLWETLDTLGVARADVAAATVFRVGDVVRENLELSEKVLASHDVTIDGVALDPDDGAAHPRFCELHGTVTLPQFQKGTPPFNTEGLLVLDGDGAPVEQRTEVAPIAINLPNEPMPPGGYPLVLYIHGSGGVSTQVVDRGTITTPGGEETKGEGPAHVLALHGIATVGMAMPLNPERVPTAGPYDYINQVNLSAFASTFRQGVFEQRLLIEALASFTIEPSAVSACIGVSLPAGETAYRFNLAPLLLQGQSMGAQYANLLGAIEPKVHAMVPTGAGGMWSKFMIVSPLLGGVREIVAQVLRAEAENLTYLHPALHMLETAWEPGDAITSLPRLARDPFDGHPARSYYVPVGKDDEYFPTVLFDAMAMSYGSQQAGDAVWPTMQTDLALVGRDGVQEYPARENGTSANGETFTAIVVQYEGDGIADPHTIFSQLDEVKYQYGCFFASYLADNLGTVAAPAALTTPCP